MVDFDTFSKCGPTIAGDPHVLQQIKPFGDDSRKPLIWKLIADGVCNF